MIISNQFEPYVISPINSDAESSYLLENGNKTVKTIIHEQLQFDCVTPCLVLVDCEVVDKKMVVTEIHVIATNVVKGRLLSWLSYLQSNMKGYFIILIGLITKISDQKLRADVIEILFHQKMHPSILFNGVNHQADAIYPALILRGHNIFYKYQLLNCSQYLKDALLTKCLLSELMHNNEMCYKDTHRSVHLLIEQKLLSISV